MKSYLEHLQNVSNAKSFMRKIDYIIANYAKLIPTIPQKEYAVLEIGPGTGEFIAFLNSRGITNIDIADLDKPVLDYIKKKFKIRSAILTRNLSKATEYRKYDTILMLQVFEHIPRDQYKSVVKKLNSILKPGGKLIMTVPNGGNPLNLIERYHDLQHENAFTEDSLRELPNYCDTQFESIVVEPFSIPITSTVNAIRILFQKLLHILVIVLIIVNGGVYQRIMTPNITAVYSKKKR